MIFLTGAVEYIQRWGLGQVEVGLRQLDRVPRRRRSREGKNSVPRGGREDVVGWCTRICSKQASVLYIPKGMSGQ